MNSSIRSEWSMQLDELAARGLHRCLRAIDSPQEPYVLMNGRRLCNLCSNNYLGLANHPRVIAAVKAAVDRWGWGAGASRLVSGHMGVHAELEERIARFKDYSTRCESTQHSDPPIPPLVRGGDSTPPLAKGGMGGSERRVLVCCTGYQANLAAIRGLVCESDVIFLDKLNHASIIDAARGSGAVARVFPHKDYRKLERLLDRCASARRRVIVTDSVFSMDGDFADLPRLVELKTKYDALLCIDEAHATGVFGERGRGLAEMMGVEAQVDVVVGTLSKALGGMGGFIAASQELIDWLLNTARAFIYTTALPPAACAAAIAALDIVEAEPQRRERLLQLAEQLRTALRERGLDIGGSTSQIVPVIVGEADAAVRLSRRLEDEGFLIPGIRPPTVPRGKARLRISLCSEHEPAEIERLVAVIGQGE